MLRNFLYINNSALDGYLSSLEDGLRQSSDSKKSTSLSGEAKLKAVVMEVGAGGSTGRQSEEVTSRSDTPNARFERLRALALSDQASSGWIVVEKPDHDLPKIDRGSMVEVNCDAYVPDNIRTLLSLGNIAVFANQVSVITDFATNLNLDTSALPDRSQVDALSKAPNISIEYVIVGEVDQSDIWHLRAKLNPILLAGEVDGPVTIVGKMVEKWSEKEWRTLIELHGVPSVGRQQRRQLERTPPSAEQQDNWLEGPAFSLEVLAIYI